jgi:hypothetical protein
LDASARQCATGERWPAKPLDGGVPAIGGNMILRWSSPITAAQLNVRGYRAPEGPVLSDAPWDDVLVVEARSSDGARLDLRLQPFDAPVEAAALTLTQLTPGAPYVVYVNGAINSLVADGSGVGRVSVTVAGPTTVEVVPS